MEHSKQIPPEIYDLLQEKSFSQLDPAQQALVTRWLPAGEYDRLRETEQDIIALFAADNQVHPPGELPDALRQAFRSKYPASPEALPLLSRMIPVWQAAAAVLLMVAVTALVFIRHPDMPEIVLNPPRDTVYLAVNDTVYLSTWAGEGGTSGQEAIPAHRQSTPANAVTAETETAKNISGSGNVVRAADMQLLSVIQKDEPLNSVTARNMNEDSLLGHIGFVRF